MSWESKGESVAVPPPGTPEGQAAREEARLRDIELLSKADGWLLVCFTDHKEDDGFHAKTSAMLRSAQCEPAVLEACKATGLELLQVEGHVLDEDVVI